MEILPVGSEVFHVDGQTDRQRRDMRKLTFAFRNFTKALKITSNIIVMVVSTLYLSISRHQCLSGKANRSSAAK